jgi:2-succinyl-5-enolpyruvyl-6-hydroxy-3-cyclohexene-1-carboxylate synthase
VRHDADAAAATLEPIIAAAGRGVVVLGRHESGGEGPAPTALASAAAAFSAASGWPLLADPLSGARHGAGAIAHYDALLRVPAFAAAARPSAVLRIGDLPASGPLRRWLAGIEGVHVLFDPHGANQDPDQLCDLILPEPPAPVLARLTERVRPIDAGWLGAWRNADDRAARALAQVLGDELSEPRVAAELGATLPPDAMLVVSGSMPVRDVETVFPVRDAPPRVLANRGANGIDGTIATAYGVAAASEGPVVLLIGDVAFAHDVGSLLTARRLGAPLTVVLIDNGGGGIFDFLPVAGERDFFEPHVATPTGLDVTGVATAFGLHLLEPSNLWELRAALEHGLTSDGTQLIHVRTRRAENVALHAQLWDAVGAALADES